MCATAFRSCRPEGHLSPTTLRQRRAVLQWISSHLQQSTDAQQLQQLLNTEQVHLSPVLCGNARCPDINHTASDVVRPARP